MSETTNQNLSGVPETYLAPLYWKAMESQRAGRHDKGRESCGAGHTDEP